ncbi:MAG: hypothetical protein HC821_03525 [Lewinella sp.]|nr:hypothetical protein [Lewinella sp.]
MKAKAIYRYDSRDVQQPLNPIYRLQIFGLILVLILLSAYLLYHYFTHWQGEAEADPRWSFLLAGGAAGVMALAATLLFATKFRRKLHGKAYQLLEITPEVLIWRLNPNKPSQRLPLGNIVKLREDVRHLVIETKAGEGQEIWLERYLVSSENEWQRFVETLKRQLPTTGQA